MSQCGQVLKFVDGFRDFLDILKKDQSGWAIRMGFSLRYLVPCEFWNQEDLVRYHAEILEDEVICAGEEATRAPALLTQGQTVLLHHDLRSGGKVCLEGTFVDEGGWTLSTR